MNGIKGYISIREASYRWGVSERRVNQYCAEGRIPGASRFGNELSSPNLEYYYFTIRACYGWMADNTVDLHVKQTPSCCRWSHR